MSGVLLYGAETWKGAKAISDKTDTFQTRCLRRLLRIFWPNAISNEDLYKKWQWIGHVCRIHATSIPRVALRWTPTGKRKRGRPKRDLEKINRERNEGEQLDITWGRVQRWLQDRPIWRSLVTALCASQHEEH